MDENHIYYIGDTLHSVWWRVMICDMHSAWNGINSAWKGGAFTWQRASIGFGEQYLQDEICAPCWNDQEVYSSDPALQEAQLQYKDIV
jgi:hypothetical protein